MARVTIADCLKVVPSRFELVLYASYRAKKMLMGVPCLLKNASNHKGTVMALIEIAEGVVDPKILESELIKDEYCSSCYKSSLSKKTGSRGDENESSLLHGEIDALFAEVSQMEEDSLVDTVLLDEAEEAIIVADEEVIEESVEENVEKSNKRKAVPVYKNEQIYEDVTS